VVRHCVMFLFMTGLLAVGPVTLPDDKIILGTELRLGMTQQNVISLLEQQFTVLAVSSTPNHNRESWLLFKKGEKSRDYLEGAVTFQNGKLVSASREWATNQASDGERVAQAVYGILANFAAEGRTSCNISAHSTNVPEASAKDVQLVCGGKQLFIGLTTEAGESATASVQEVLEAP
jgi:hypothetical protein